MSDGRESDGFAHHVWTAEEWGWRASDAGPPGRDGDLARDLVGVERMDRKPGEPFMGVIYNEFCAGCGNSRQEVETIGHAPNCRVR